MKKSQAAAVFTAALLASASFQYFQGTEHISAAETEIFINEVCSQNKNGLTDSYGKHADWIEIFNSGSTDMDISGYGLSDRKDNPMKWVFPEGTMVPAGDYLIVFASENESVSGELHTGFSLSKNGETLVLSSPSGNILQEIQVPVLGEDSTFGRTPDGSSVLEIMSPTPGKKNENVLSAPVFSEPSGFYSSNLSVSLSAPEGSVVYYTSDGSNPLTSSTAKQYSGQITVTDRSSESNIYSAYEADESDHAISRGTGYQKPNYNVDKATVLRAAAKSSDGSVSEVSSQTYFITNGNLSKYKDATVISLVTDPENLFDSEKGIYVTGKQYTDWKNSGSYNPSKSVWDTDNICNYFCKGSEWEREAQISVFEKGTLSVNQGMGIRIKGASTRNTAQKSFNIYARSEYGASKINSAVFPDNYSADGSLIEKYDALSIRSVSDEVRLRDGFAQRLLKDRENLTTQSMKPAYLFLNGEFWGLYEITEKLSDYFIESNYGVKKQDVAMIKGGESEEGDPSECQNFLDFADKYASMDLTNSVNYQAVCDYIDTDSMIEHYAAGIYLGTYDWPSRNYGVWRNTGDVSEDNPYTDGKWRFITYDLDYTMGATYENFGGVEGYAYNSFRHMEQAKKDAPTNLFIQLLKNPEFRAKFVSVYCDYANIVFSSDKTNAMAENYSQNYTEPLANTELRWWGFYGGTPDSLLSYYRNEYQSKILSGIKNFFRERPSYSIEHLKQYLGLNGQMQAVTVDIKGKGKVRISSVETSEKWSGKYLSDSPVILTAIPDEGSEFTGWSGDADGSSESVTVTLSKAMSITASFGEAAPAEIKGDVNGDGSLTAADISVLIRYLLGSDSAANLKTADINSDGKINIIDLCLLKSLF